MGGARTFFDISFTRTQPGTVGISRTVRRLFQELERQGRHPVPVAFHSTGFRQVEAKEIAPRQASKPDQQLFRLVTGKFFRRVVTLTLWLPWSLLSGAWAAASTRIFNGMTEGARPVDFQPGDVLFMCDASWNYPAWIALRRAREQGARVVLLVYDLIPLNSPQFCYRLTTLVFGHWLKKMVPLSDALICISRATQDEVAAWIGKAGLPQPALGYFHLGADLESSIDASPRLREFFAHPAPTFVTVGTVEPRKNHAQLLEAFERLWAGGSPARLLIIGKPTIDCEQLVQRLRTHPENGARLMMLADGSDGEIRYAYGQCSALVFPSLAEGFGLPLVEARACGCRVLASNLGVFREFADDSVRYFAAGSTDALHEALCEALARPAAERASRTEPLSWTDSAAQFARTAERLLRHGG